MPSDDVSSGTKCADTSNKWLRTGWAEAKKSMSFPTVNGIDRETEDETRRRPTAMPRFLLSGFARATIFRKDEALLLSSVFLSSFSIDRTARSERCGVDGGDVGGELVPDCVEACLSRGLGNFCRSRIVKVPPRTRSVRWSALE